MRITLTLATLLAAASCAGAADTVELEQQNGNVAIITIDGRPFAKFVHEGYKKPFLIDIHAPNGTVITRSMEQEAITDHPHHKGLWLAIDEVNGLKHWNEGSTIRAKSVAIVDRVEAKSSDPTQFRVSNEWLDAEGQPLLLEKTTITVQPDRLIAYDIRLTPAGEEAIEFGDTKEGFFAIRLRDELREQGGTGKIVNANGQTGEAGAWGQTADWVDYSGEVDGETAGVAIFDHPDNPRPGRYHVRGYGLFAISPFGQSAYTNGKMAADPIELKPGESLRLRYAAWIHDGDAEQAGVAARHDRYVEATSDATAPK